MQLHANLVHLAADVRDERVGSFHFRHGHLVVGHVDDVDFAVDQLPDVDLRLHRDTGLLQQVGVVHVHDLDHFVSADLREEDDELVLGIRHHDVAHLAVGGFAQTNCLVAHAFDREHLLVQLLLLGQLLEGLLGLLLCGLTLRFGAGDLDGFHSCFQRLAMELHQFVTKFLTLLLAHRLDFVDQIAEVVLQKRVERLLDGEALVVGDLVELVVEDALHRDIHPRRNDVHIGRIDDVDVRALAHEHCQDDLAVRSRQAVEVDDTVEHRLDVVTRTAELLVEGLDVVFFGFDEVGVVGELTSQVVADELLCAGRQPVIKSRTEASAEFLDVERRDENLLVEDLIFELVSMLDRLDTYHRHRTLLANLLVHTEVHGGLVIARVGIRTGLATHDCEKVVGPLSVHADVERAVGTLGLTALLAVVTLSNDAGLRGVLCLDAAPDGLGCAVTFCALVLCHDYLQYPMFQGVKIRLR